MRMPADHELRETRQRAVLAALDRTPVASQLELVEELRRQGIAATQSSISRDLRELGVARIGGHWRRLAAAGEQDPALAQVGSFVRTLRRAGPHLTIILTPPGAAQSVARAIDVARWPEVVGTLAGDDTIFIATAESRDQDALVRRLSGVLRES
jgi:transcriptional regulator of arginine metabolism